MKSILLTGAGGNVTNAIIKFLPKELMSHVYITSRDSKNLPENVREFDFEKTGTFASALAGIDLVFLLRPPQISDVKKYFRPFINACKSSKVQHIIFLSVQGAEKISFIPHAKIERLIINSGLSYTFVRPSYFMQNLITTLKSDIREKQQIFLPAGKALFLWIDVDDIGKVISKIIVSPEKYKNIALTLTGRDLMNFGKVADILSKEINKQIKFVDSGLVEFYFQKRREGYAAGNILVLIMLHYLARFQAIPESTDVFQQITGVEPNSIKNFIKNHKYEWL